MGEVKKEIKLTNYGDIAKFRDDLIAKETIRSTSVEMVVDTGATMMIISEEVAKELGIKKQTQVYVKLADDSIHKHYKGYGILVEYDGRDCVCDCIILERGVTCLLGQIPLEEMDLVVDCNNKTLLPNPQNPAGIATVNLRHSVVY